MLVSKPIKLIVAFVPLQTAAWETEPRVGRGFIVAVTAVLVEETELHEIFLASE